MESNNLQDYSNPQQGTMASPQKNGVMPKNKALKLPPTRRDNRKIFVGGLPSNVTDEEFNEFFSQFGTVVDSTVMFDRETRRSRGFGFVTYEDPNVVHLLLEMRVDGTDGKGRVSMRGKVCEIKAAEPKESSNNANGGGRGRRGSSRGYRSYPPQGYPVNGEAYQPGFSPERPVPSVNQGVPSSLPPVHGQPVMAGPNGQHVMYPPYGMGAYYPAPAGMPGSVYPPYVGYDGVMQGHPYYEQQMAAEHPAYSNGAAAAMPTSAMTATAPGPRPQQNGMEYVPVYADGFVPVENGQAVTARQDESPPATSSGEEAKQT